MLGTLVVGIVEKRFRRFVVPGLLVGMVVVGGLVIGVSSINAKVTDRAGSEEPVWDRLNTNRAALGMVEERPLLGWGWNTFPEASLDHFVLSPDHPVTGAGLNVHNVFLGHAVELGLVGFVLWLVAFFLGPVAASVVPPAPRMRPWRLGMIALLVQFLVVATFQPLAFAMPNLLVWLWAGVVVGGRPLDGSWVPPTIIPWERDPTRPLPGLRRILAPAGAVGPGSGGDPSAVAPDAR